MALKWRDDFLLRNPNVVPYLTDSPPKYKSEAAALAAQANQPNLTQQEWIMALGVPAYRLINDDGPLPEAVRKRLQLVADQFGWDGTVEELATEIQGAQ
jgi:hypothetical protein